MVANCDHLKELRFSYQNPYAFTEQGVSMLSAVLKSETAINISIKIMDAFVAMRHALLENHQLFNRISEKIIFSFQTLLGWVKSLLK